MIKHCNILTWTGDGRQQPTPLPGTSRKAPKYRPALLFGARQTPVEGALRRGSVVRIVLNLGRRAGQRAPLPRVLAMVQPDLGTGVGESDVVLQALDSLVLIKNAALDAFLGSGSEIGRDKVRGQVLRGGASAARSEVGYNGAVGQGSLLVRIADHEIFLRGVGTEELILLLNFSGSVLDSAYIKDVGCQLGFDVECCLIYQSANGRFAQIDGIVLRWVELTAFVVVRVALELVWIEGPLATQRLDRGRAVLGLGLFNGTCIGLSGRC